MKARTLKAALKDVPDDANIIIVLPDTERRRVRRVISVECLDMPTRDEISSESYDGHEFRLNTGYELY